MSSLHNDQPVERPTGPPPSRPQRLVRDADGMIWRVRELLCADTAPSLVFESEGVARRVRAYPRTWFELTEVELLALSWKK